MFDSGGFADALAMSGTGDLYIADAEGGLKILAYHTSTDSLFESFEPQVGAETRADGPYGMAFSSGATPEPELYMTGEDRASWGIGWRTGCLDRRCAAGGSVGRAWERVGESRTAWFGDVASLDRSRGQCDRVPF